jgi:predicted TIM-barrel fold metal-dependent hydrolase
MEIVDLQLHDPGPCLPWDGADLETRRTAQTEVMLTAMEAVGVDAVALHPVEDNEWALRMAQAEPGRFASIPMITGGDPDGMGKVAMKPDAPDLEDQIAAAAETPGLVALRAVPSPTFFPEEFASYKAGGYDRAFAAAEANGIPMLIMVSGHADTIGRVAEKFPDLQIVLDHIGISQRPMEEADEVQWAQLPSVLGLAQYPNVSVKLCNPVGLSEESYPFNDVWPHMHKLLEAFGAERLGWASDIGRFQGRVAWNIRLPQDDFVGKHNYMESLAFFLYTDEISLSEKEQILGKSARRMLKWPATQKSAALA